MKIKRNPPTWLKSRGFLHPFLLACSQDDSSLTATQLKIYHLFSIKLPNVGFRMRHEFSSSSHPLALQTLFEDSSDSHASKGFCKYSSLKTIAMTFFTYSQWCSCCSGNVPSVWPAAGTEKLPACCNATHPFLCFVPSSPSEQRLKPREMCFQSVSDYIFCWTLGLITQGCAAGCSSCLWLTFVFAHCFELIKGWGMPA